MRSEDDRDQGYRFKRMTRFLQGTGMMLAGVVIALRSEPSVSSITMVSVLIASGLSLSNWPVARELLKIVLPMLPVLDNPKQDEPE